MTHARWPTKFGCASKPLLMVKTAAQLVMERETRVSFGPVPHRLSGEPLAETRWQMLDDEFLLRGEGNHYFHYRKGNGITVERGANADCSEEALWLNGSVHAAVASMNGLLPIHASAVAVGDHVFAFTGPAGAGKSTLVAALGDRGLPMFCDDTLVLDLSDPDRISCLPGHKRLKLTAQALGLTMAERQERVSSTVKKFYALPCAGDVRTVLPLAKLVFLEEGAEMAINAISGAECFVRIRDDHQMAFLFAGARRLDRPGQFSHFSRLARQIEMACFVRPRDTTHFDNGVSLVARYVKERAGTVFPGTDHARAHQAD